MAIIQFQNGTKVQFNGDPTPQDVEEVAQSLGITPAAAPAPQENKVAGFFKGVAKGVGSTVKGLGDLGAKGLRAIAPAKEVRDVSYTSPISQEAVTPTTTAQKVGFGAEQIAELFIPAGKALKAAKAVTTAAKAAGQTGKALKTISFLSRTGGQAAAAGATRLAQTGGDVREAAQYAAGAAVGEAAIGPIVNGVVKVAGRVLQGVGKGIAKTAFPMTQETARIVQAYKAAQPTLRERIGAVLQGRTLSKAAGTAPVTEAATGLRQGLVGTEQQLGVQAKRAQQKLWDGVIKPTLEKTGIKVNMKQFFQAVEQDIKAETSELGRRNALLEAVKAIKQDYRKVGQVSLGKLQDYKAGWAKFVPERFYKGKPIAGNLNEVRQYLASRARQTIYDAVGDPALKQAYLDYGNLTSIAEAGIKAVDPLRSKGLFKQTWELVVDDAITPVASFAGQVLYRTGRGLEFVAGPGLRTVGDVLSAKTLFTTTEVQP